MISVIIPVYNKEKCIKKTIKSVLSQTYEELEILCINDGSTDATLRILKSFEDKRINIISQVNSGVSAARNKGLENAKGEWLFFLDADDELLPDALETLYKYAISGNYFFAVGNIIIKTENEKTYCNNRIDKPTNNVFKDIVLNRCFPRTGNILFKNLKNEMVLFDRNLSRNEDIDFFTRLLDGKNGFITQKNVLKYVLENNSLSKFKKDKNKDYIFHLNFQRFNFWGNMFLGTIIWDNIPGSLRSLRVTRTLFYFLLSFFPFFYRMILYKISPSL